MILFIKTAHLVLLIIQNPFHTRSLEENEIKIHKRPDYREEKLPSE